MTMPHLMNCNHSEDGWCLDCVKKLWEENHELRIAMCFDDYGWRIVEGGASPGCILIEDESGHRQSHHDVR